MPTLLSLMSGAAADAGIVQPGQTPSSGVQQPFILEKFNEMVQNFSANRLLLTRVPEATYALQNGVGRYEIGTGASHFASPTYTKPIFVEAGVVIIGTAFRKPLNILTAPQWNANPLRGISHADGPIDFYYEPNTAIGYFNVAPMPTGSMSMVLAQWNPLKTFLISEVALNIEDYYSPEYIKLLRIGLAMELAPAYRLRPDIQQQYVDCRTNIEKVNAAKLAGSQGSTRTLDAPTAGQGVPVQQ